MSQDDRLVGPGGESIGDEEILTERSLKREEEEELYHPVIVKRMDEIRRHPDDMIQSAVGEGLEQLERGCGSLFLSSIAAGLILCFTAMAVGVMTGLVAGTSSPLLVRVMPALVYPLGFIVCIMSGTQLFTEHTATAVYPVLDRKAPVWKLLRLWVLVILGNLAGTAMSAGLLAAAEEVVGASDGYLIIARHLVSYHPFPLFISAVLAGWLMALGAWLILTTSMAIAQIAFIYFVTFLIGIGGLHHSIAGSAEMFVAMFVSDEFTVWQASCFIFTALAGNLVGGSAFVAGLNYAHIRSTQTVEEPDVLLNI